MLRCNISQRVPQSPVVSVKSGHVFERSLVEKYIEEHGHCPVTGETLRKEDLVAVQGAAPDATTAANGSLGAASIPTLLGRLQAEWDGAALEKFTLRQQMTQMQQELAHVLQQYDAACRVIARLTRELANARGTGAEATLAEREPEETPVVVPEAVLRRLDEVEATERRSRKQRKSSAASSGAVPSALVEEAQWATADAVAVKVAAAGDSAAVYGSALTGDHAVVRYSTEGAVEARGLGHTAAVHTLVSEPSMLLSAAEDDTVRVWKASGAALRCQHTLRYPTGVAALSRRTVGGIYALSGASDGSLYLSDIIEGLHIVTTAPLVRGGSGGLTSVELHPYASLAAVALQQADLQLWDTRAMEANTVLSLPESATAPQRHVYVQSLDFGADCVSLAAGRSDGSVCLWDLRQPAAPLAVLPATAASLPATVRYAPNGRTLAVVGDGVSLYAAAKSVTEPAVTLQGSSAAVFDASWIADGSTLVTGSVDGVVRLYAMGM